jgi:hypothetical protein
LISIGIDDACCDFLIGGQAKLGRPPRLLMAGFFWGSTSEEWFLASRDAGVPNSLFCHDTGSRTSEHSNTNHSFASRCLPLNDAVSNALIRVSMSEIAKNN